MFQVLLGVGFLFFGYRWTANKNSWPIRAIGDALGLFGVVTLYLAIRG